MPKIKSAKKALRQSVRRRKRNLDSKKKVRTSIKAYKNLLKGGKKEEAQGAVSSVYKTLDKAAKKGVIKKNTASRLKSRLTKALK
ncbi:MAG: 30S ribosomal protein S20 [Patescibacteria group bacterium]|nr:30S ribosomal protein S20 [Patescibacteria group bacterium]